eukprot:2357817-Prymnesium_polylepis.1
MFHDFAFVPLYEGARSIPGVSSYACNGKFRAHAVRAVASSTEHKKNQGSPKMLNGQPGHKYVQMAAENIKILPRGPTPPPHRHKRLRQRSQEPHSPGGTGD